MDNAQKAQGKVFKDLHSADGIFVMPNAWNAGSACMLEAAGFPAVSTTSAGIAFCLGLPDYEGALTREAAMDETRRIAGAVRIPVSVDAENGYGHTPEEVVGTIRRVAETGAVGASIEDKESYCSDGSTPVSIQPARQLLGKKFNFLQKSLGPSGCPFGIHLKAESANRGNNRLTKLRAEGLVQIEFRHYPLAHRYPTWDTKIAAPGFVVFSGIGAIRLLLFS